MTHFVPWKIPPILVLLFSCALGCDDPENVTAITVDGGASPLPGAPDGATPGAASSRGRLLIGDGDPENPRGLVLDLDDGQVVLTFSALASPSMYATSPGSGYGYVTQRLANLVEIVSSGLTHGQNGRVQKLSPTLLTERFEGPVPTHWVAHDTWVVSFNDGDGSFDYLLESTLGTGRVLRRRGQTGRAHHGVAAISHGNIFASTLHPTDPAITSPVGVTMRRLATPETVVKTSLDCPGLHGEGANHEAVAFGCTDGVLVALRTAGDFVFKKLPNPEGAPAGQRVGTVRTRDGLPRLIGNWGQGFVIIDYQPAQASWTPVSIGVANLAFLVDQGATRLLVLGGDGALRTFDPLTGAAQRAPLDVIAPWMPAAGTSPPRPALAVGDEVAFVSDPRTGEVIEVDLDTWKTARKFQVGGQPNSLAAFSRLSAR